MRKILTICLICTVYTGQLFAGIQTDEEFADALRAAEEKFSEFIPELKILRNEYPDNTEIQLGLAFFCNAADWFIGFLLEEQCEKVLAIDPNNRPAWSMKAKTLCRGYTAKRNSLMDQLEGMIDNTRKQNLEELKIMPYSRLHSWFKGKGKKTVVIRDFDLAVEQLRQKFDREVPRVLAALNEGQSIDPDNALYNYLKAHLYFELDEKDKAIKEIEKAVAKKHVNNYFKETRSAAARVLLEINFPEYQREFILDRHIVFADFLHSKIWKEGLAKLAKDYEAEGNLKNAKKIDELIINMAKQIREEPLPYSSYFNQSVSQNLEGRANRHIQQLHEKMATQLQQPALEQPVVEEPVIEQPVVEEPVIDVEELINWLDKLWLDGELKEIMTEEEYLEFRKSIEESPR